MERMLAIACVLCVTLFSGSVFSEEKQDFQFKKQPEIQQVKPRKPVRIKLHRSPKDGYSWDLTGDNVDEIIKADRRIRSLLKIE
jgi:predicted secreted protein